MLSCKEISHLVSESLDRKLPFHQRLQVRLHLLMCQFCSRFRKQLLFLRDAARHYLLAGEETEPPPLYLPPRLGGDTEGGLSPDARARIKRSLKPDPP